MDATLLRGRWTMAKTARQYIDDGTLALAKRSWTKVQSKTVKKWSCKGTKLLKRLRQVKKFSNAPGNGRIFGSFG